MPYSNYTKIRDVLQVLDRLGSPQAVNALAERIREQQIESFAIWRASAPDSPAAKSYCSADAVRRLIRFAGELGLVAIDEQQECSLARPGRNALTEGNYDKVLSTHLALYLKQTVGLAYSDVRDVLNSIRRPEVPSFETICRKLVEANRLRISEDQFRAVLYLMERCGMLTTQIRKIYFAPEVPVQ